MNSFSLSDKLCQIISEGTELGADYQPFVAYESDVRGMIEQFPAVWIYPDQITSCDLSTMRYEQSVTMLVLYMGDVKSQSSDYNSVEVLKNDIFAILEKLRSEESVISIDEVNIESIDKHYHRLNKYTFEVTFDVVLYDYSQI